MYVFGTNRILVHIYLTCNLTYLVFRKQVIVVLKERDNSFTKIQFLQVDISNAACLFPFSKICQTRTNTSVI